VEQRWQAWQADLDHKGLPQQAAAAAAAASLTLVTPQLAMVAFEAPSPARSAPFTDVAGSSSSTPCHYHSQATDSVGRNVNTTITTCASFPAGTPPTLSAMLCMCLDLHTYLSADPLNVAILAFCHRRVDSASAHEPPPSPTNPSAPSPPPPSPSLPSASETYGRSSHYTVSSSLTLLDAQEQDKTLLLDHRVVTLVAAYLLFNHACSSAEQALSLVARQCFGDMVEKVESSDSNKVNVPHPARVPAIEDDNSSSNSSSSLLHTQAAVADLRWFTASQYRYLQFFAQFLKHHRHKIPPLVPRNLLPFPFRKPLDGTLAVSPAAWTSAFGHYSHTDQLSSRLSSVSRVSRVSRPSHNNADTEELQDSSWHLLSSSSDDDDDNDDDSDDDDDDDDDDNANEELGSSSGQVGLATSAHQVQRDRACSALVKTRFREMRRELRQLVARPSPIALTHVRITVQSQEMAIPREVGEPGKGPKIVSTDWLKELWNEQMLPFFAAWLC